MRVTLEDIESLDSNIVSISIPNHSINNGNYNTFNFSRFILLEELIIGDECFENVNEFKIDRLNHLKSIKIGINSFTHLKSDDEWNDLVVNNPTRSFHLLNCNELESIIIGIGSFSDYGGGFELKNLPKLTTIKIDSHNFCYSSFEIRGIINVYIAND